MTQRKRDPYKLIKTTLADKYLINEFITSGGMSHVYKGSVIGGNDSIAIKMMKSELVDPDDPNNPGFKLFNSEVAATRKLNHPNIVKVVDSGVQDGLAYIVMEWLTGQTLQDEMSQSGKIALTDATAILRQICAAIGFAHQKRILHLDIKPSNIFLVPNSDEPLASGDIYRIKVIDFGLARLIKSTAGTTLSHYFGTPKYSAPEMYIKGKRASSRSDIHSLGAVAYELLTGTVAFSDTQALLRSQNDMPPPSLSTLRPDVPVLINDILSRSMSCSPEARPKTVEVFFSEFERATRSGPLGETATSTLHTEKYSPSSPLLLKKILGVIGTAFYVIILLGALFDLVRFGWVHLALIFLGAAVGGLAIHWLLLDIYDPWTIIVAHGSTRAYVIAALEPRFWRPIVLTIVMFFLALIVLLLAAWLFSEPLAMF